MRLLLLLSDSGNSLSSLVSNGTVSPLVSDNGLLLLYSNNIMLPLARSCCPCAGVVKFIYYLSISISMAKEFSKAEMDATIEKKAREMAKGMVATMRTQGKLKPMSPESSNYILHGAGHPMKFSSLNATMQNLELYAPHKMDIMKSKNGGKLMTARQFHKQLILILGK